MSDETAKIYSNQRTVPIYLGEGDGFRLPGKAKWRLADAAAFVLGALITGALVTFYITADNWGVALGCLVVGSCLTLAAVVALSMLPVLRPAPIVRAVWFATNLAPRVRDSGR